MKEYRSMGYPGHWLRWDGTMKRGSSGQGLRKFPKSMSSSGTRDSLGKLGHDREALECFERRCGLLPSKSPPLLYNKCLILTNLSRYRDAVAILDLPHRRNILTPILCTAGVLFRGAWGSHEADDITKREWSSWRSAKCRGGRCIYTGLCSVYSDLGMKNEAMEIAYLKELTVSRTEIPHCTVTGNTLLSDGLARGCEESPKGGLKKFPNDEELTKSLREVEEIWMTLMVGGGQHCLVWFYF